MEENRDVKRKVQDQFGRNAEKYVQSESHAQGDDLPLLLEWLQPEPDWMALDVATGGGMWHVCCRLIANRWWRLT